MINYQSESRYDREYGDGEILAKFSLRNLQSRLSSLPGNGKKGMRLTINGDLL